MKRRNFSSMLNVKKINIAKLDGDKMMQFVGGYGTVVGTDRLCDKSKLNPSMCDIVVSKPLPPTNGSTIINCCTHVNC